MTTTERLIKQLVTAGDFTGVDLTGPLFDSLPSATSTDRR